MAKICLWISHYLLKKNNNSKLNTGQCVVSVGSQALKLFWRVASPKRARCTLLCSWSNDENGLCNLHACKPWTVQQIHFVYKSCKQDEKGMLWSTVDISDGTIKTFNKYKRIHHAVQSCAIQCTSKHWMLVYARVSSGIGTIGYVMSIGPSPQLKPMHPVDPQCPHKLSRLSTPEPHGLPEDCSSPISGRSGCWRFLSQPPRRGSSCGHG